MLAGAVIGLSACTGPDGQPISPFAPPAAVSPAAPAPNTQQVPQPAASSQPDEYHSGYDIGGRDASYGYPADARRACERFGHGSDATFSEGYADGYAHNAPRR